jgi:PAS domain S-box-containing protein
MGPNHSSRQSSVVAHGAEEALRVSEERLRLATRGAGIGIFDYDAVADRCIQSPEAYDLLGAAGGTRARLADFIAIVHRDDRARVAAAIAAALDPHGSGVLDEEFRILRVDTAETRWVKQTAQTYFEGSASEKRAVRVTGAFIDINERKIREARDRFLLTLNDQLRSAAGPLAIQKTATRLLGEHLQANRIVYLEVEGDEFVVRESYTDGVAPFAGRGPVSMFGEAFLDAYRHGETVVVNDVSAEPLLRVDERRNFLAAEIAAFTAVTLVTDARWVAALCVEQAIARVWTPWEIELTRILAERIWQAVERARAEAALEASEHKLRLGLVAANLGTWRYDISSGVFEGDDVTRRMHGFGPDHVIETLDDAVRHVHPDDLRDIQRAFVTTRTPSTSLRSEYRVVLPDGGTRWLSSLSMPQAATTWIVGVVADVTERKRKEIDLQNRYREQGRTLRLLLENAAQGILSVDAAGTIVMANRACETMFGWPHGGLVGRSVEHLVPSALRGEDAEHRAAFANALRARVMASGLDVLGQRKDGSIFPIEVHLTHVSTPDGGHTVAFISDVTVRRQAERALADSHAALQDRTAELERRTVQLSRLASELTLTEQRARERLAKMLHDGLQQSLFSASLKLEQLKMNLPGAATRLLEEARAEIGEAIDAARTLSFELAPPEVIAARLAPAVTWLADRMWTKYGLRVRVTAEAGADVDRKDVRMLVFESLREILFNVVKHGHVDSAEVSLAAGADDMLVISVTDRGAGFDLAALDDGRTGNTGLGLLSIRERLAWLGGRLEIESSPGRGAQFRLVSPRLSFRRSLSDDATARGVSAPPMAPTGTPAFPRLRILLADDHPATLSALRSALSQYPELDVVGDARNGVDAIAQAKALRPDVVLMDVSMPVMDGVDATRSIHEELPSINVIGLSAAEKTPDPHPIELAGAVAYFQKNADMRRLIEHVLGLRVSSGLRHPTESG